MIALNYFNTRKLTLGYLVSGITFLVDSISFEFGLCNISMIFGSLGLLPDSELPDEAL
jgi:hypothetical protein